MKRYLDAVIESMEMLGEEKNTLFLGNNINFGSFAYGTLKNIPEEKRMEMPVAENLMMGVAIGLSIEKYKPVVIFERHDFMLNALDSIVNHLDKIEEMSYGQFKTPVIIRAIIGGKIPLDPGPQHTQNFTAAFKKMINFPIFEPKTPKEVIDAYQIAKNSKRPVMVVEERDLYLKE
jgi:pyruvate/2-oxoglutarate/acetoin dehydrogenase E1 component